MANALKCPNPTCPYLFDPSGVPAGMTLSCPRCGMRFTLAAPPVTEQIPISSYPAVPSAAQEGPVVSERQSLSAGGVTGLSNAFLVIVTLAMLLGAAIMVYFRFRDKPARNASDSTTTIQDRNLSFTPPDAPWTTDEEMVAKIGSPVFLVFKRTQPEAYMAFGTRDFETRMPRPSEIREGLTRPLNHYFEDLRPVDIPDATWLGKKALAFEFRARLKRDGVTVAGECHAVSYKGIAYWSICWAGESDASGQLGTFASMRDRFKLLDTREKWQPREATIRPFGGHKLGYQLLDSEGIWIEADTKQQKPEDLDPNGDLLLIGTIKRKGVDLAPEGNVLVSIIANKGSDPLTEARQYLQELRKAELSKIPGELTPMFEDRTNEPEGDPTMNTIDQTAPVARLDCKVPGVSSQTRLYVISAIKVGDKLVIAIGWCSAADRALFETKLIQLVGSLRESS